MAMYLGSNKVEIGTSSGGGSSDFSTAEVTVVNTHGSGLSLYGANTLDDGEDTGSTYGLGVAGNKTAVFSVILYKGTAWLNKGTSSSIVSVSGSAEKLGSSMVMVTGDCTITIS